jgi:hypothetical protein
LAIRIDAGSELMNRLRAEWPIRIRTEVNCRIVAVGAECRRWLFRLDRRALPSARRVSRWMMISVAIESSADESREIVSRHNRMPARLRRLL